MVKGLTMRQILSAMVIAALLTAACGKSEEQKQAEKAAEDLKKAAEAMGQAAAQVGTAAATAGTSEAAKALQGMAAAMGGKTADGKPVDPVAFQTLQTAFPEMSGWNMDKPQGERMTMPMPFSQSETSYRNGDQRVDLKITDTAFAAMLLMPFRMISTVGYSRETTRVTRKRRPSQVIPPSKNGMPTARAASLPPSSPIGSSSRSTAAR